MGRGPGVRWVSQDAAQIDFRYKGVRCRERLRLRKTAANDRFARNLKARIEHEIQTGTFDYARHFPASRRAADRSATLSSYLNRHLGSVRVSPETLDEYTEAVEAVPQWLVEKRIGEIGQHDYERWLDALSLSRKRLNNLLIPHRAAFRRAYRDGEIKSNPLQGIRLEARKTESEIDPFSRDEIAALSDTATGSIWKFWVWTGVRSGELAGIEWGDVEPSGLYATIRRAIRTGREKTPKTRAGSRRISLLQPAREALGVRGEGRIFLNPATGEPFQTDRQIREAFRKACKEGDVRYRYPYQLRHTHASIALSAGENPLWIAKQMGHKDVSMVLRIYGRYMPEFDAMAGRRMVAYGESDGKPKPDAA